MQRKPFQRKNEPAAPLLAILRDLETKGKREEFARLAGTSVNYLYQLGTCKRKSCRVSLAKQIADASVEMNLLYGTPVLTLEQVAMMCAV
jgi:hypothetical protein